MKQRGAKVAWCAGMIVIAVSLSGCYNYQYFTMESDLPKNENYQFQYENDTFRLKFWFSPDNGTSQAEIFNKLQNPIYVDWRKSAFIRQGKITPLWEDASAVTTQSLSYTTTNRFTYTQGLGIVYRQEPLSIVHPQAYISNQFIRVSDQYFSLTDTAKIYQTQTSNGNYEVQKHEYSQRTTPFTFRLVITLSTREDFASTITVDKAFWAKTVLNTTAGPQYMTRRNHEFFTRQAAESAAGTGVAVVCGLLVMVLVVASHR